MWSLKPIHQKSFYGKALVDFDDNVCRFYLYSYGTLICSCDMDGHDFKRHWADWSATTAKHINAFRKRYCNLPPISKSAWIYMPVN